VFRHTTTTIEPSVYAAQVYYTFFACRALRFSRYHLYEKMVYFSFCYSSLNHPIYGYTLAQGSSTSSLQSRYGQANVAVRPNALLVTYCKTNAFFGIHITFAFVLLHLQFCVYTTPRFSVFPNLTMLLYVQMIPCVHIRTTQKDVQGGQILSVA